MTLYAVAYSLAFDSAAADAAVTATFHEVWRSAASFNARAGTVVRWLADLTRRGVRTLRAPRLAAGRRQPVCCDAAPPDPGAAQGGPLPAGGGPPAPWGIPHGPPA